MSNKTNKTFFLLLCSSVFFCACKNTTEQQELPAESTEQPPLNIEAVTYSKSDYAIPETLRPVWTYGDGYTAEQTISFRDSITPLSGQTADDVGSYWVTHWTENSPSAIVHRGGPVALLESAPLKEIEQVGATTILGTMTLKEMMEDPRSRMKAIAVIHNGKIVYEKYIGMRDWDNHVWASGTKIFNGLLAFIAEKQGLLDVNKPITDYLPELRGTDWEEVKVEDALHQRSGLDISESRMGVSPTHPVSMLYRIAQGDPTLPEGASLMSAVKTAKKALEPGIRYEYASINTHVITVILERIYNKPIEDIISTEIWMKAGMEGDGTLGLSASGEPMAFGAFSSRLRDFARYGILFTPSWNVISSEQVISDAYFDKVRDATKPEVYGEDYMSKRLIHDFGESDFGASYQWDAVFEDGDLYKSGRTGQCLYVSPETNTVVVWYSSAYQAEVWVHAYAREIVKQAFRPQ